MKDLEARVADAVRYFWETRTGQRERQGQAGYKDVGGRSAVTGGAQLDGFINLVAKILMDEAEIPESAIHVRHKAEIPGFFRATKRWDLVVTLGGSLVATVEFKSHVGPSFSNNYNNRAEEALGNAYDLWTAYREGAFKESSQPWLGYLMLLEEHADSMSPVVVRESHFPVFEEFRDASYAQRYELLCRRIVRERLYDAGCLLLSDREGGLHGEYREPAEEIGFRNFIVSLTARVTAHRKLGKPANDGPELPLLDV